jgi:hypothetical protein
VYSIELNSLNPLKNLNFDAVDCPYGVPEIVNVAFVAVGVTVIVGVGPVDGGSGGFIISVLDELYIPPRLVRYIGGIDRFILVIKLPTIVNDPLISITVDTNLSPG